MAGHDDCVAFAHLSLLKYVSRKISLARHDSPDAAKAILPPLYWDHHLSIALLR